MRLAVTVKTSGHEVKAFLMGEGVEIEDLTHEKFNVAEQVNAFYDAKGQILACGTCLKVNARLKTMAQYKVLYGPDTDFTQKESQYFTIDYQAKSWERVRKVAVKATREAGALLFSTFEFIVSNFADIPAQTLYKLYQKRGTMENYIKEIKRGFSFDKTDSSTFLANQARMMISWIAYTVIHLMKELTFPEKEKKSTIATIRFKVFHIAGKLTRHARKIKIRLSTGYVFSSLFWTILENIQQLVLLH